MGSRTFDGVWFAVYSHDHPPPHAHGRYEGARVIIDLLPDGTVREAKRWDAIRPSNAKRSAVRHILHIAAHHATELLALWELTHETPSE